MLTPTLPPGVSGPKGMNAVAHCAEALYAPAWLAALRWPVSLRELGLREGDLGLAATPAVETDYPNPPA